MKQQESKWLMVAILVSIVIAIVFPIGIAWIVYNPNILLNIPGKSDVWMGFWASYSGTIVTIIVAVSTWRNSMAINDLQTEFYELNAGINLRLVKVYIVPIVESGNLNRYKAVFCFHNMAKSLIRNIDLSSTDTGSKKESTIKVKVGNQEDTLKISSPGFGLQADMAILQFEINFKESEAKQNFIDSYFYFSQFPLERNSIVLETCIRIDIDKNGKIEEKTKRLNMVMFSEPVFESLDILCDIADDDFYMSPVKMKIKQYTWGEPTNGKATADASHT